MNLSKKKIIITIWKDVSSSMYRSLVNFKVAGYFINPRPHMGGWMPPPQVGFVLCTPCF